MKICVQRFYISFVDHGPSNRRLKLKSKDSEGYLANSRWVSNLNVRVETSSYPGVDPVIAKALTQRGFKTPTPIQRAAIPLLIGSPPRDVLGMARTGSGKTFAYIVPLLQRLTSPGAAHQRALILIPTRELALQVLNAGKDLSRGVKRRGDGESKPLRWGLIMGGDALDKQFELMESKPDM